MSLLASGLTTLLSDSDWSDDITMWVADEIDAKIYAYDVRGLVDTGR